MAYLKADIVSATLVDLGVRAIGETAATGETTEVGTRFDAALDLVLKETGVTINPASISTHLYQPLVGYLVQVCAPTFGAARDDDALAALFEVLVGAVRQSNAAASSVKDLLIEEVLLTVGHLKPGQHASATDKAYVSNRLDQVIADLAARAVIYIASAADIEDLHSDALIDLLAAKVAPKFGGRADRALQRDAEARLFTIARIGQGTGENLRVDAALRPLGRTFNFTTGV